MLDRTTGAGSARSFERRVRASCTTAANIQAKFARRGEQYRAAIAEYKLATVLSSQPTDGGLAYAWNQPLPAGSPVKATVSGSGHMDIIRVTYPDTLEPYLVHPPEDYTNNLEVRVKGSTLYVYRAVTLLWTEYRLAVYDLANRKLLVDLLVAPEDMSPRPERR